MKILILNGPNLNLLGTREPTIYGGETLSDIKAKIDDLVLRKNFKVDVRQSNLESELISWVQNAEAEGFDAMIINPAAFGHTSVALRDALATFQGRKVEVHLSNTYKREEFRKSKLISSVCDGVIEGFGSMSYLLAVESLS